MKLTRISSSILAAAALLSVQSCLKEQHDVFPKSSSERLQEYLEEARQILTSSETGWIMEYYPGKNQKLGGYTYYLKFTDAEVEATFELDPDNTYRSLYKMTADNGPVLSFDTYNKALHYFATPSSGEYQAKGGDFEFTITSVSPEKIGLRGKRSGNRCDLYPYSGEDTPEAYVGKVADMAAGMRASIISGKIGETEVSGTVDFDTRHLTFKYVDETAPAAVEAGETKADGKDDDPDAGKTIVSVPFMYTADGLKTYGTAEVAGYSFDHMFYHSANNILTTGSVVFAGSLPEDYTSYSDFAGNYTLSMYNGKIRYDVTLSPDKAGTGYVMSGLLDGGHDVALGYSSSRGRLSMNAQAVGADGSNTVYLAAWSLEKDGGSLFVDEVYGMEIVRDLKTGNFKFVDNGKSDSVIDSFILWGITSAGGSAGEFTGWGESQYPYLQTLTRK